MSSLCLDCATINLSREHFTTNSHARGDSGVIRHGTLAALKHSSSHCALCRLLLHAIQHDSSNGDPLNEEQVWSARWYSHDGHATFGYSYRNLPEIVGSTIVPELRIGDPSHDMFVSCRNRIQLVDDADIDRPLGARLLGPKTDVDMIRRWIAKCNGEHGPNCKESKPMPRARCDNLLCIDVHEKCLVTIDSTSHYVALSYVWGPWNEPQTRLEKFSQFSKPGAFASINLPRTISDSIAVAAAIGYRYLWVDSLCIVQDLEVEKIELIRQMDIVYGNADLTIVAASGENVQCGLSGWDAIQGQRRNLNIETLGPGLRIGVLPDLERGLEKSLHATRGWTYQETYLSRRCLVFFEGFVSFHCGTSVWREDLTTEIDGLVPFSNPIFNITGNITLHPQKRFARAVEQYSSRQLSHESDYQFAFAGIQSALTALMENTKIWFGMPASAFDWAMLWQNAHSIPNTSLIRRTDSPSWSWMGYKGQTKMENTYWDGHRGVFDQEWLRQRTWIDWYIVHAGHIVPVWDPVRDDTEIWSDTAVLKRERNREGSSPISSLKQPRRHRRRQGQNPRDYVASDDYSDESSSPDDSKPAAIRDLAGLPDCTRLPSDSDNVVSQTPQTAYSRRCHRRDDQSSNFSDSQGSTYSSKAKNPVRQRSPSSSARSSCSDSISSNESLDDGDPFPQYGSPEPSNAYGREIYNPAFAFLKEFKPVEESSSFLETLPITNFPSLYFSTILCSYYLDQVSVRWYDSDIVESEVILKDRDNIGCGIVHLDVAFMPSTSGTPREVDVLILSWTPPGTRYSNFLPRYKESNGTKDASDMPIPDGVYGSEGRDVYDWVEYRRARDVPRWNRFNVLLVKRLGDHMKYERIGTGELFTEAVKASVKRAEWTNIILL